MNDNEQPRRVVPINPNGSGRHAWPHYDPRRDEYLELGRDIGVRRDSLAERLDLLARWEATFGHR